MTRIDPLLCLMKCLVGVVLGVFAAFEYLEQSYLGYWTSFLWSFLAFASLRNLTTGLAGLLEIGYARLGTWVAALLLSLPCTALGPRLSTSYLENYEKKAWAEVSDSRDATLWQHRYTVRVPERFRRPGWNSLYVVAVCQYSVEKKEYSSLGWYSQQVFDKNPEKYDDKSRQAIKHTVGNIFARKLEEMSEKRLGDAKALLRFQGVLDYLAEHPWRSNQLLFRLELKGIEGMARDFLKDTTEDCGRVVKTDFTRSLARIYPAELLRFPDPGDYGSEDLQWTVTCIAQPARPVNWAVRVADPEGASLFDLTWQGPPLVAPASPTGWSERQGMQVLQSLRQSARAFLGQLKQKLALVEAVENR